MAYDVWSSCMLVPGFSRSECASWVQAWGSILAIIAAPSIAMWQMRAHDRAADRALNRMRLSRLQSFQLLVGQAVVIANQVLERWDKTDFRGADFLERELEVVRERLDDMPRHDAGDPQFISHLTIVETRLRTIWDVLRDPHFPEDAAGVRQQLALSAESIVRAQEWCTGAVRALQEKVAK